MTVLVLTACPSGLRGHLTRWLLEVSAGVFVGRVSQRIRQRLWNQTKYYVKNGRALLIYTAKTEQGYAIESHGHHWNPVDYEGVTLMLRPSEKGREGDSRKHKGWSAAGRRRRYGRR